MGRVSVCLSAGRAFLGCDGTKRPWFVEVCLCSLFICSLDPFLIPGKWFCNRYLYKPFSQNCFVGLMESTSLWVGIPVEVRLPTAGSPQTPRKRDPHWELLLLLLLLLYLYSGLVLVLVLVLALALFCYNMLSMRNEKSLPRTPTI